jgi:hypothetical protein
VAAPTAGTRPTATPTATNIGKDDDDEAAPDAEPRANEEPLAGAAGDLPGDDGDLFAPPLPEDHAAELETVEEEAPDCQQKDPGAGLPGTPAPVNDLPEAVYDDWPNHNDGCHLDAAW